MSLKSKNTQQVRFTIDAHTNKVIFAEYSAFGKKNSTVFTLSCDMSWALWNSATQAIEAKVKLIDEPNAGLTLENNCVVVGDVSDDLKFYQIKD